MKYQVVILEIWWDMECDLFVMHSTTLPWRLFIESTVGLLA